MSEDTQQTDAPSTPPPPPPADVVKPPAMELKHFSGAREPKVLTGSGEIQRDQAPPPPRPEVPKPPATEDRG